MANNFSNPHQPRVVKSLGGRSLDRSTIKLPMANSAALYMGAFVPIVKGTDAAPVGVQYGVEAFADDGIIGYIVVGFSPADGDVSLLEASMAPVKRGTITDQTGELPAKYTAASTNDQSNGTSMIGECAVLYPIFNDDIIEVALWGASTISVARGTTTAFGSDGSSANMGVGLSVNTTYHFALTESTANKTLANLDFLTTLLDGKYPSHPNHVYARLIRGFGSFKNAE